MTNYEKSKFQLKIIHPQNQEDLNLNVKRQSIDTNIKMTRDVRII